MRNIIVMETSAGVSNGEKSKEVDDKLAFTENEGIKEVMEEVHKSQQKLEQMDPFYAKVEALYDDHITGNIENHPNSYFPELIEWFAEGSYVTKIRSFELILRLLQPGRWQRKRKFTIIQSLTAGRNKKQTFHVPETQPPSGMGMVAFRLLQLKNRGRKVRPEPPKTDEEESEPKQKDTVEPEKQNVSTQEIINWIKTTLEGEENKGILTIFFLFMKTHAQELSDHGQLAEFHYHLLKVNHEYAKLQAFERLQQDWFSSGYRPQV